MRFGKWKVLYFAGKRGRFSSWACRCECGTVKPVFADAIKRGASTSCGCTNSPKERPAEWACKHCKAVKPFTAEYFPANPATDHGLNLVCIPCTLARSNRRQKIAHARYRRDVLRHYSGGDPHCECCGETEEMFLTIDHPDNSGAEHRRAARSSNMFDWLFYKKCPPGFRVLCFNCNCGRARTPDKVCPHKCSLVPAAPPKGKAGLSPAVEIVRAEEPRTGRCQLCKRELPLTKDHFRPHRSRKAGWSGWCLECSGRARAAYFVRQRQKRRRDVYRFVSGSDTPACACCGEPNELLLSVDHVDGGGWQHVQSLIKEGTNLYLWILKHRPTEGFRILCYNCNCGRARTGDGVCPHKKKGA